MYITIIAIIILYIVLFVVSTNLDDKIKELQRKVEELESKNEE